MNFFKTRLEIDENGEYYVPLYGVRFELNDEQKKQLEEKDTPAQDITLGIRPEHVSLCEEGGVEATVDVSEMMGSSVHLHCDVQGDEVVVVAQDKELAGKHDLMFRHGEKVRLHFDSSVLHLFGADEINLL